MPGLLEEIRQAVLNYDEELVKKLVTEAIKKGMDPIKVMNEGLSRAIREVGDLFGEEKIFLSELMLAANACMVGTEIVKKRILETKQETEKPKGVVVIGTVEGDVHNIGKDIVKVLLEASGYLVYDIGIDQKLWKFFTDNQQTHFHGKKEHTRVGIECCSA